MPTNSQYYFNGVNLGAYGIINNLVRPMPPRRIDTAEISGKDGTVIRNSRLDQIEISMLLWITDLLPSERRDIIHEIAGHLMVDAVKPLQFDDDDGLYYLAMPKGDIQPIYYPTALCIPLVFLAPDPVMYGQSVAVTVSSGSSVSFNVGGNYPTYPQISSSNAVRGSGNVWGLALEDGTYSCVLLNDASSHSVSINAGSRAVTVDNTPNMITLSSDWLDFTPGNHAIAMSGTGTATVSWTERWL